MSGFDVNVTGDVEVAQALKVAKHRLMQVLTDAVSEAALDVERDAKRNTPVDTGRLRSSIGVERVSELVADVGTDVEYASYVELGTSTQPAQPYLTPARERAMAAFPETVKKHARRVTGG